MCTSRRHRHYPWATRQSDLSHSSEVAHECLFFQHVGGRCCQVVVYMFATVSCVAFFLQCSDIVGWAIGRTSGLEKAGCWFVGGEDFTSFARLTAPVVTTEAVRRAKLVSLPPPSLLSSNKIRNGDIVVPANPGPRGKWLLKWRDSQLCCMSLILTSHWALCSHVTVLHLHNNSRVKPT